MKCCHCKKDFKENEIEIHHIHPRFMDNQFGDGMKLNLCNKCHMILHLKIPSILWRMFDRKQKIDCIKIIKDITKKYGGIK